MGHFLSLSYHDTVNQIKAPTHIPKFYFPKLFVNKRRSYSSMCGMWCKTLQDHWNTMISKHRYKPKLNFSNLFANKSWSYVYEFLQSYIKPKVKLYDFQTLLLKKHPAGFCQPNFTIRIHNFHAFTFETPILWYNFFFLCESYLSPLNANC